MVTSRRISSIHSPLKELQLFPYVFVVLASLMSGSVAEVDNLMKWMVLTRCILSKPCYKQAAADQCSVKLHLHAAFSETALVYTH